ARRLDARHVGTRNPPASRRGRAGHTGRLPDGVRLRTGPARLRRAQAGNAGGARVAHPPSARSGATAGRTENRGAVILTWAGSVGHGFALRSISPKGS